MRNLGFTVLIVSSAPGDRVGVLGLLLRPGSWGHSKGALGALEEEQGVHNSLGISGTEWFSGSRVLQEKLVALGATWKYFRPCFIPAGSLDC